MNKLGNKKNLQVLLDFLLTTKEKDFEKGLDECDLTSLKIFITQNRKIMKYHTIIPQLNISSKVLPHKSM